MSELEIVADGGAACVLSVRAQPGAKRAAIAGIWNGQLKVAVTAPPERGRANAAVIEVLARALDVSRSRLALIAGERARQKRVHVELSSAEVRRRLLPHLG